MRTANSSETWVERLRSMSHARDNGDASLSRGELSELVASHNRLRSRLVRADSETARCRFLEAQVTLLEGQVSELKAHGGTPTGKSSREVELDRKLADLQEKLRNAMQEQLDTLSLKYTNQTLESQVSTLRARTTDLEQQLKREKEALEAKVAQLKDDALQREKVVATLKTELAAFQTESGIQRKRMVELEEENARFLRETQKAKDAAAAMQLQIFDLEEALHAARQGRAAAPPGDAASGPTQTRFSTFEGSGLGYGSVVPAQAVRCVEDAHSGEGLSLAVVESGRFVWSGGADKLLRSWDAALNPGPTVNIATAPMCMDSAGERLVVGGPPDRVSVYDLATSRLCAQLTGHTDKVFAAYFCGSTHQVISSSADRTIRLWDVNHSSTTGTIVCPSICYDVSVADNRICSGHFDGSIRFWDPRTKGEVMEIRNCHDGRNIISLRWTLDRNNVVSMGRDNKVRLTDCRMGQLRGEGMTSDKLTLTSNTMRLGLSPDGAYCACGSGSGALFVWSLHGSSAQPVAAKESAHKGLLLHAVWLPDGKSMVSIGQDRRICLWK